MFDATQLLIAAWFNNG